MKHSVLFDAGHPQKGEAASPHYRFDQPLRRFAALIAAIAIAAILVSMSAFAVSEKEAATVVRLLEALQEELGDFAYDASVADDWFEQDADSQGLIAEAGFTRASWKKALDETYAGFLANMPETDILGPLADARRRVEAKGLSDICAERRASSHDRCATSRASEVARKRASRSPRPCGRSCRACVRSPSAACAKSSRIRACERPADRRRVLG